METTGIKISQLDPIPQDWTEEQIANLMDVGLIPISLESMEMTFKATLGLVLSYALGKSNSAESIAEDYSPDKSYKKSEFCLHERDLYVAKNDMPAGDWNESNWSKVPLSFFVNKIPFMIALQYDKDSTYNKGSYCCNDYTFYKCKENNVTGAFNATKWDEINVAQELSALWQAIGSKSKLSDFTDDITLQIYTPSGNANARPISSAALANFGTIIISPNYAPARVYNKGNICFKDGFMYESKENNVTGEWDASKWKQTNLADYLSHAVNSIADTYIYLDAVNGDDTQDGLGKYTSVKTLTGAIQAYKNAVDTGKSKYLADNLSVYVLNGDNVFLRLPSNAELAELSQTISTKGISLFSSTNIKVENDRANPSYDISYPIKIKTDGDVTTEITGGSNNSATSPLTIECRYATSILALTSGNLSVTASSSINLTAVGTVESASSYPNLTLKSGGTITFSNGSGYYFKTIWIEVKADVNINCELHHTSGECIITSIEGSINFSSPLYATDYNVILNAGKNINNTAGIFANNITCVAGGNVTVGGSFTISGKTYIKCNEYIARPGSNEFLDDAVYEVNKFSADGISNGYYKNKLRITSLEDVNLYAMTLCNDIKIIETTGTCTAYTIQPHTQSTIPVANSKYVFELGNANLITKYSDIRNQFADVRITTLGDVELCTNNSAYCKSLSIKCSNLKINNQVSVGFFNIDVSGVLEQTNLQKGIVMALEYGGEGSGSDIGEDYISYDVASTNSLKANILSWPSTGNADYCGLISTYYGIAVKNISIDINMLLAPSYSGSGGMSPSVLAPCLSGVNTFNSVISGHIGGYVFKDASKVSSFAHDAARIDSSYQTSNPNARVTLKWENVVETLHFYYDPNQGNDAFDGVTRKTPVKTCARLISLIKNANDGAGYHYEGSGSSTRLVFSTCISLHILSASANSMRGDYQYTPAYGSWEALHLPNIPAGAVNTLEISETTDEHGTVPVMFNMLEILPEAPNLQVSIKYLNANLLYIHDFDAIRIVDLADGSGNKKYIQATSCVTIENDSTSFGGFFYYSHRVGPITIESYDVVLKAMFNCLYVKAAMNVFLTDSTGGPYGSDSNQMIGGASSIEASNVYIGDTTYRSSSGISYAGIAGICSIKAVNKIEAYIDDINGILSLEGSQFRGSIANKWFKGDISLKFDSISLIENPSFYNDFSNNTPAYTGGCGSVKMKAKSISSNLTNILAADIDVRCGSWSNSGTITLYGGGKVLDSSTGNYVDNTSPSNAYIDVKSLNSQINYFGYNMFVRADYVQYAPIMNTSGPFIPNRTSLHFDYGKCFTALVPLSGNPVDIGSDSNPIVYEFIGSCKVAQGVVFSISNNPPATWQIHGSFNVRVDFSNVSSGDAIGQFPEGADFTHEVIILNKSKRIVAGDGITITDTGDTLVIALDSTLESILSQINTQLEQASGDTGMYDLGTKTEADLVDGKLTISTGNSVTHLNLETVSVLTIVSNPGVPNFAILVDNSINTHDVVVTVVSNDELTTLRNSVTQGTTIGAGKIMQLTAVGDCWVMGEFEGCGEEGSGSDEGSGSGEGSGS